MIRRLVLLAAAMAASPAAYAVNLLTNGSFETPVVDIPYVLYPSGSMAITGWTAVGPGDMQNTRTEFVPANDGAQWVDLTGYAGYDKGIVSDPVATEIGQTYRLSFDLGAYEPFGNATASVSINGGTPSLFVNLYQSGVMDWERKSLTWVADAPAASVQFLGVANGVFGNDQAIGLDNVVFEKVTPVPEPGTYVLLAFGLGCVGFAARRRAR